MDYEIDFLPVGEASKSGDAIALRFGQLTGAYIDQTVIVVDGGYQADGEALVAHVQQHYKTNQVDALISTHPDCDHANGLEFVMKNLRVSNLLMHLPWNNTRGISDLFKSSSATDHSLREQLQKSIESARSLQAVAQARGIKITEPFTGVRGFDSVLQIIGPTEDYYFELLADFRCMPMTKSAAMSAIDKLLESIAATIDEKFDIETLSDDDDTSAENNSSVITLLRLGTEYVLLTGDAGKEALAQAADELDKLSVDRRFLRLVQIPHHGSRRNVGPKVLDRLIGPKLPVDLPYRSAFVSVAPGAEPKHPSRRVLNAFRRRGFGVHATQGRTLHHRSVSMPMRDGYGPAQALPFFETVEHLD